MKTRGTNDKNIRQTSAKAKRNVQALDQVAGFQDRELKTILAALEAGLRHPESNAHFDAFVILAEVVHKAEVHS